MIVTLTKVGALLCIKAVGLFCQPVLYGDATPVGTYTLTHMYSSRLHDHVLVFKTEGNTAYAIHRVWQGNPSEHRDRRLLSPDAMDNRITHGCVNVGDEMFAELWKLPDGVEFTIGP